MISIANVRQTVLHRDNRFVAALIGIWVLSMITLPIFKWTFGPGAIPWGVVVTTILQATATVTVLASQWGIRRALTVAGLVMGLTWAVEALGTATGFPFGHYTYTDVLQPQLLNVPVIIAIAWLMMLPSAWAVAYVLNGRRYGLRFVVIAALAMTAWDLFLDPQMVSWNLWTWDSPGTWSYFGVPWVNFLGWIVTAALVTVVVRPNNLPVTPLLTIYGIVWVLQTIGMAFFWGLVAPALVGFVGMGAFVLLVTRQLQRERHA